MRNKLVILKNIVMIDICIIICIIAGLSAQSSTVMAEDCLITQTNSSDLTALSLEDLMNIEVTSASKKPEKAADAPASVYVITHEDIERYGCRNIGDALKHVAGLYISSDRNYDYLGVRGYARPGDYNTRILLLIDGLRVNDPMYNTSPTGDDLSPDIRSVERIEVVKGPGSALWGTNAMLAVINVITRQGSDIEGSRFAQDYGSDNTKSSFFEFGSSDLGNIEFAGSVAVSESDGQNSIYFPDIDQTARGMDDASTQCGYVSVAYKGFKLFTTSGKYRKVVPTGSYNTVFNDPRNHTVDSKTIAALSYEQKISRKHDSDVFMRLYSNSYDYNGDYIYDMGYPTLVVNKDIGSAKWWGGEARYSSQLSPKLSFVSGIEYMNMNKILLQNYYCDPYYASNLDTRSSCRLLSYYLQTGYDLSQSLRFIAGTRLDDYSIYGKNWSPRGALVKKLNDSSTLKLLWGKAFRTPDGYENDYTKAILGITDSGLAPEEIETTELVWDKELNNHTRLITSIYRYDLKNIIAQVGDVQFENLETVRSEGIESQLDYRLRGGASAYLGMIVLNARDTTTDHWISNSPHYLLGCGVSLPVLNDKYYFSPEIQLIGPRKTLAGNTINASTVIDLALRTVNSHNGWDVSVSVYNLFDTIVYVPGSMEHMQDRLPQEGRTFQVQTSYHF